MNCKRLSRLIAVFLFLLPILSENAAAAERQKYWIFFRDKGPSSLSKRSALLNEAKQRLSAKSLERRAKVLPGNALVDESDFDLYPPYWHELTSRGFEPVVTSRWLNAVSIFATPEEITALQNLPFVAGAQRVARLAIPPAPESAPEPPTLFKIAAHRYEYGSSLAQMEQIKATLLHDAGINGTNVIVGMMDSGFRWQDHEAFAHLETKIIGERDFIQNDDVTRNQTGDAFDQDSHGTETLSTLGGFRPGELIGPGFGARFILAKTEHVPTETHAEEDYWAQAVEWMENLGVDVTSTSLGYGATECDLTCCPLGPTNLYSPADMNGKTAIITKAAEIAASKGVIVVNSAGNDGNCPWHIVTAPADGPNVITVGAVFSNGGITSFSSRGPTADGRIKPDVMAMGAGVSVVSPSSTNRYTFMNGTSFSCPLTAGVVAQILSAHPETTPQQMMNALRSTASRAHLPDNDYGYGIVNAVAAITSLGPAFSNEPEVVSQSGVFTLTTRILSRDGITPGSVRAHYANRGSATFSSVSMSSLDSTGYLAQIPRPSQLADTVRVYFAANDLGFGQVTYPKHAPQKTLLIRGDGIVLNVDEPAPPLPTQFVLEQNRPNPFGSRVASRTTISFVLPKPGNVRIRIFNTLGQRVRTIFEGELPAGRYASFFWDGTDDLQRSVAGGVYFYEVLTPVGIGRNKMLLLR
jgi:subtilisin family serine protease